MTCSIDLHRRLLMGAGWFSSRRNRPSANALFVFAISSGLKISQVLERSVWRHLVRREPGNTREAEQKTLYIIAATLARAKTLEPGDVSTIVESTVKFRGRLDDFLRKVGR